ncbi:MAG: arginine--tRNA ligase [Gammaproteobacteria bacterium]
MKDLVEKPLQQAVDAFLAEKDIALPAEHVLEIERTRDSNHGDFASNIAMSLAKHARMKPRDIAREIVDRLPATELVDRIEIAGPGFINFFLDQSAYRRIVPEILAAGERYGTSDHGGGRRVLVEFVSANPTGPLHIGHGRGAAYGATLADVLAAAGFEVEREYYVNDAGRQMDILALSTWLRYLSLCGVETPYPEKAYRGHYVRDIAARLQEHAGDAYAVAADGLAGVLVQDDEEKQLDDGIAVARNALGREGFAVIVRLALEEILADIREDLLEFGVRFDNWFSEQSLQDSGAVQKCVEKLRAHGDIYEQDGAQWFRSSHYGDEKDRVVVRENGQTTYFASDIAYHLDKFERGFDLAINILGADHHGYIDRLRGSLRALGLDDDRLQILLVQFASLYRGSEKLPMSTRSGDYVTLRDLRKEVGNDAARFFYVTRKSEQHLDFDMELAKSQSSDNPVYYIQYAHARICSVLLQMRERGYTYDQGDALENLNLLVESHELALMKSLSRYPEVVLSAATGCDPHQIAFYLRDLSTEFHTYYNSHQFLVEEAALRQSRISLILAVRQVIRNGLSLLGVSAPEEM